MIIVTEWADWLQKTSVLKFEDPAQAESYVASLPDNYTAFTFNTENEGGLQLALTEMLRGRNAAAVVDIYNALDANQPPIKCFHDRDTATRRIGQRLIDRAEKGAVMRFTPKSDMVQTPDGRMPAIKQPKGKSRAKGAPSGKPGVIQSLIELLKNGGGTVNELFEALKLKYPERGAGMKTTVGCQVRRLHQQGKLVVKSQKIEGRGTVFSAD